MEIDVEPEAAPGKKAAAKPKVRPKKSNIEETSDEDEG
jgi:hypothetical protein